MSYQQLSSNRAHRHITMQERSSSWSDLDWQRADVPEMCEANTNRIIISNSPIILISQLEICPTYRSVSASSGSAVIIILLYQNPGSIPMYSFMGEIGVNLSTKLLSIYSSPDLRIQQCFSSSANICHFAGSSSSTAA